MVGGIPVFPRQQKLWLFRVLVSQIGLLTLANVYAWALVDAHHVDCLVNYRIKQRFRVRLGFCNLGPALWNERRWRSNCCWALSQLNWVACPVSSFKGLLEPIGPHALILVRSFLGYLIVTVLGSFAFAWYWMSFFFVRRHCAWLHIDTIRYVFTRHGVQIFDYWSVSWANLGALNELVQVAHIKSFAC